MDIYIGFHTDIILVSDYYVSIWCYVSTWYVIIW
jgi:hypothetical protein